MKIGVRQLIDKANEEIETLNIETARALLGNPDVQFIDLRDVRELQHDGVIPGAFHAPRGMLEFWVDPDSPYHKDVFASGRKFVFYCASAWRSALATKVVQDMGLGPVCHLEGGFKEWQKSGAPVEDKEIWDAAKAAATSA